MIKLWGRTSSFNVQKVQWVLAELGLTEGKDYERIDAGLEYGINNTPEFLKINPNGLVPTIDHDGFVLWESSTVIRYLVAYFDPEGKIFTNDIKNKHSSQKWMDWHATTLWPILRHTFVGLTRTPEAKRNYELIRKSYEDSSKLLKMFEDALHGQDYCGGSKFHLGDMCLAVCVARWKLLAQDFPQHIGPKPDYPLIDAWMKRLLNNTKYPLVAETKLIIMAS